MKWKQPRGSLLLLLLALLSACASVPSWKGALPAAPAVDTERIQRDVQWLADEEREGRGLATAGLEQAARHLAEQFRAAGFQTGVDAEGFLQTFQAPISIRVAEAELRIGGETLRRGEDFDVLLASASGELHAEFVFAGYGISDPASGHDDYAGLEVEGLSVVVLDGRPELDGESLGGARGAAFTRTAYKLMNARQHGAAAVILVPAEPDVPGLPGVARQGFGYPTIRDAGVIAVSVSREVGERLLRAAGAELDALQETVAKGKASPAPLAADVALEGRVRVERIEGPVSNVVGLLPGWDPALAHEVVVIGAHYDHLGRGDFGSLAPDRRGEVHAGADDNASGTAGLLALARVFGRAPPPRRSLLLLGFTAEEAGLLGSAHYVEAPAAPLEDTVAMINLDMIGRLRDDRITVFGAETSPSFPDLVEHAARDLGLRVAFEVGAQGPSDQTSFANEGIPVLFFFTGTHPEYHTPDDLVDKVDAEGIARISALTYRVARALLDADDRPSFADAAAPQGGSEPREAGPGYGPYLGTVPAFGGEPVEGVRLSGVREGSPAEKAGLRGGDVIVSFDGSSVRNLDEFAALLFSARPGQSVAIVVERGDERVETRATLGPRR